MTHISIVLTSIAILDDELERALKKAMRPLPRKLYEDIFESLGGPLSTFSGKVLMARALGIVTVEIYDELDKIRRIRNDFAHSISILNFESEKIAPRFAALKMRDETKASPADQWMGCITTIHDVLEAYVEAEKSLSA